MKQQISKLYVEYGRYINKYRAFPLIHDGLKIVERRLLYSLYQRAKDHYVKSAEVVGWCIGQYHPHGDVSAYGSLVQLVAGKLAIGQGNWGCGAGIVSCGAAAMRYTEIKSSKDVLDMAFEFIDYVRFEELEIYSEPVSLPSKLPLCLVNECMCQGIGFGSRTVMPNYKLSDLVKRLKWLLTKEGKEPIIRPMTDCNFISGDKEFLELLTTGKAKIDYRGKSEIDYSNKSVVVKAIPPGKSFISILKKMEKDIEINKTIGFIDESTKTTKVRFISTKRSLTLDQLNKKVNANLVGSLSFECNMCDDDGNVVLVSIDNMLLNVYNNYIRVVEQYLNDNIVKLQKSIDELTLILKIKAVLPKWLREHPDELDVVIAGIAAETSINNDVVKEIFSKYTLSKILKIRTDITDLQAEKITFQNNLNNIKPYVWSSRYQAYAT